MAGGRLVPALFRCRRCSQAGVSARTAVTSIESIFVEAGFVEAGFVEAGFVEAGFVETGFIETGFIESGGTGRNLHGKNCEECVKLPLSLYTANNVCKNFTLSTNSSPTCRKVRRRLFH
jgi:hypothetical protein